MISWTSRIRGVSKTGITRSQAFSTAFNLGRGGIILRLNWMKPKSDRLVPAARRQLACETDIGPGQTA